MAGRKIYDVNQDGVRVELYGKEEGDLEFFIDGVHGVHVTASHVKLNLYSVSADSSPNYQRRETVCRMVLPIGQFVQFSDFLASQAQAIRQAAQQAAGGPPPGAPPPGGPGGPGPGGPAPQPPPGGPPQAGDGGHGG